MADAGVEAISFESALKAAGNDSKSVLLGNGFSIAQGGNSFNYSSLLEKSGLSDNHPIRNVFKVLDTFDFEEVMAALNHASKILDAYGDKQKSDEFAAHASELRDALIRAVHEVHPGVQFDIPAAQIDCCANFLEHFEAIYTTNYDLLLYWVIVNKLKQKFADGFGLGEPHDGFKTFDPAGYCATYYLHGALHLFLSERRDTLKRLLENTKIIDDIAETIKNRRQLPLFVAEGMSSQKMAKINSVPYLKYCYDELSGLSGALFVFGLSANQRDRHIFDAIFQSKIRKLFFFIHQPQSGFAVVRENLAAYSAHNRKVAITYVDTTTAKVWK